MSKKRKTKKEKILTESRKNTVDPESYSTPTYSFSSQVLKKTLHTEVASSPVMLHTYVAKDIKHTLIITSVLSSASVLFYILIQSHIIRLANFGY